LSKVGVKLKESFYTVFGREEEEEGGSNKLSPRGVTRQGSTFCHLLIVNICRDRKGARPS
jgi:hypothetical protein